MSDILKNEALIAIQGAMMQRPIGTKNISKGDALRELRSRAPKQNTYEDMYQNKQKPTLEPDPPKDTEKNKTYTAQPRRAN
tara:strand:+ start:233 stop:475 length:243 start_codon:yes stop_codon:yes gene_type:complete